jgi:hypothetical protein
MDNILLMTTCYVFKAPRCQPAENPGHWPNKEALEQLAEMLNLRPSQYHHLPGCLAGLVSARAWLTTCK